MFKMISNFKKINIPRQSVIFCDIDNTILHYYNKHVVMTCDSFTEFNKKIAQTSSFLILLTNRDEKLKHITESELRKLDIYYEYIAYTNGKNKGFHLLENIHGYNCVNVIDSDIKNLYDIYNIYGKTINYYHFQK